ncbi:MAG: large subunit ribosomal protein [Thermoproteota archaeon]|nr:large subunit ribosomal protein [Thermoproteota archaeon]
MPKWGYSFAGLDTNEIAKASGRDLRISPKAAREICKTISQMRLDEAKNFLQEVVDKKRPVPYRKHKKEVSHKAGLENWYAGKYPVKAAKEILKILDSLEANAETKGLDVERLKLVHSAAQRARVIKRFIPRAFGRSSPNFDQLCHVEFAVEEVR